MGKENGFECEKSECNRGEKHICMVSDSTLQLTFEKVSLIHFVIVSEYPGSGLTTASMTGKPGLGSGPNWNAP